MGAGGVSYNECEQPPWLLRPLVTAYVTARIPFDYSELPSPAFIIARTPWWELAALISLTLDEKDQRADLEMTDA